MPLTNRQQTTPDKPGAPVAVPAPEPAAVGQLPVSKKPGPLFNPERVKIPAGSSRLFDSGTKPDYWYVYCQADNVVGLGIHPGEMLTEPWVVLFAGQSTRFPAQKSKRLMLQNMGMSDIWVTITPLSGQEN